MNFSVVKSSRRGGFINRKKFSPNVRYNLGAVQNRVIKKSTKSVLCAKNGQVWRKRVVDSALCATLLDEEITRMFGTSNIFILLDRLNEGKVLDPIAVEYIDDVLERHFLRYLNRLDLSRYEKLVWAGNYPSCTIEYLFLKARAKFYHDNDRVSFYEACLAQLQSANVYSVLHDEECVHEPTVDVIETCAEHNVVRVKRVRPAIWDDFTRLVEEHPVRRPASIRDATLLRRLRKIIASLSACRTNDVYADMIEMDDAPVAREADIIPQMMEPEKIDCTEKGAVVLTNSETCKEVPAIVEGPETFWAKASTSDAMVNASHSNEFEILANKLTWSTNFSNGTRIATTHLPIDVIAGNPDNPAAQMFSYYAYAIFTMRARLHFNTTPMHTGKVIMYFYYSAKLDINYKNRLNNANGVMFPHVFFNASSGEDACLDIPFRNHRSFLCTRKRDNDSNAFYMGTLVISVFNHLNTASDVTSVDGYLHISFHDNHFSGLLKRAVIQAQMFSIPATIKAAESALNLIDRASNMDKPPVPAVPTFMQPTFTSSFASGDQDISTINHLRLNPRGQTQHPAGSSTKISETSIDSIKLIPGLLAQLAWSVNDSRGFKLWSAPATLALPTTNYPVVSMTIDGKNFVGYVLPPVCMLADMHGFSRGAFEIIVEIVCSRFHTGALLIAYTPAVTTQNLDEAVQSYNMTLDVGSTNRYTFRVPYIAERPLSARYNRSAGSTQIAVQANGVIGLYVLNSLRTTASSTIVPINIFIKGTEENEFMCLTAPNFTVIQDKVNGVFPEKSIIPAPMGAIGLGTWRYSNDIQKGMAVLRYAAGSDDVLQFPGIRTFVLYKQNFQGNAAKLEELSSQYILKTGSVATNIINVGGPAYIARLIVNGDGDNYSYAVGFNNDTLGKQYVSYHYKLRTTANPFPNSPKAADFTAVAANGIIYLGYDTAPESYRVYPTNTDLQYVEYYDATLPAGRQIVAQMDGNAIRKTERAPSCKGMVGIKKLMPLGNGMRLFGETFNDLKTYTRRYQLYGSVTCKQVLNRTSYCCRVPIVPCGLAPSELTAYTREGLLTYINANYVFGRGGILMKIMIEQSRDADDTTYYIQHKYDLHSDKREIVKSTKNSTIPSDGMQSGYAVVAINPKVNSTVTIEIPCYIATNLMLVQRSNPDNLVEVNNASLGVLDVFSPYNSSEIKITFWYALADDFEYSCYIGLPPVIPVNNLASEVDELTDAMRDIVPQMDAIPSTSTDPIVPPKIEDVDEEGADEPIDKPEPVEIEKEIQPEGFSSILGYVRKHLDPYLVDITKRAAKETIRESFGLEEKKINDTYGSVIADLLRKVGDEHKHIIISIISQIIHYIRDPCIATAVVCVGTLFVHLGFEYGLFDFVISKVMKLFGRDKEIQPQSGGENESEESPKAVKLAFVRAIVAGCSSRLGFCVSKLKDVPYLDFSKGIWNNIRFGSLTFNALITLIKNLVEYIPKIFEWLSKHINPARWWRTLWYKDQNMIDRWIADCTIILDPNNAERVHFDARYSILLQMLVLIGKELSIKMARMKDISAKEFGYIRHLNSELNKLYSELIVSNAASGVVRVEPYCWCAHGASQVGKTFNSREIAEYALAETGLQTLSSPTYIRQPGLPFWDGARNQMICVIEDFLQFEENEKAWADLYDVIHLVSCQVFQPPQADLKNKHIRFAPLMVVLTMNNGFKRIKGVADNNAWMNRRHDLFEYINAGEYDIAGDNYVLDKDGNKTRKPVVSPKEMSPEGQRTRNYLVIKKNKYTAYKPPGHKDEIAGVEHLYDSLTVPQFNEEGEILYTNGLMNTVETEDMNFYQFRWYITKRFSEEYTRMVRQYKDALKNLTKFWPADDSALTEKIVEYATAVSSPESSLSDAEKRLLEQCAAKDNKKLCKVCYHHELECTCQNVAFLNTPKAVEICAQGPTVKTQAQIAFEEVLSGKNNVNIQVILSSYVDRLKVFKESETYTKSDNPILLGILAKDIFSRFHWRSDVHNLFGCKCLHQTLTSIDWMSHFSYFEFDKKCFSYLNEELAYPSRYCCGDNSDKYWLILQQIEARQIQEGVLINRLPIVEDKKNFVQPEIYKYLKGEYKKHEDAYRKFRDAVKVPEPWYAKWGKRLFAICKIILGATAVIGSMFGIQSFLDSCRSDGYSAATKHVVDTLLLNNSITAKCLLSHVPNEKCTIGECPSNICGNMAYGQRKALRSKAKIEPQMALDLKNNVESLLCRNTFFIRATFVKDDEKQYVEARCLGLCDKYFVAIDHYFDRFQTLSPDTIFEYVQPSLVKEINYARLELRRIEDSCLVVGVLPKTIPAFSNIVPKICSAKYGANLPREGLLYELKLEDKYFNKCVYSQDFVFKAQQQFVPPVGNAPAATRVNNYYEYNIGAIGMCGSILVSDSNIGSPIIGIHYAGTRDNKTGYAELLSRETFESILDELKGVRVSSAVDHVGINNQDVIITPQIGATAMLHGNYKPVGCVKNEFAHRPPPKSKQVHSECYGEIYESTYDYPLLSPNDPRASGSPMVVGCSHHVNPPKDFNEDLLLEAVDVVRGSILSAVKPKRSTVGPLTREQVIVGIPENALYNALEFDTSEGFPFTRFRPAGAKDKRWLFDLDVSEDGYTLNSVNPLLTEVMDKKHEERKQGIIPVTVFTDCLKDIKVPAEKIQPRIFSISPADFTIQFKQYYSDFMIAYQEARFDVNSAIGINVDSLEWTKMVNRLNVNSPHYGCGDYSKFGPRLMSIVVRYAFQLMNEWYDMHGDSENSLIREVMAHEVTFANHMMFNFVYKVICGAPSGSPITTILNNIVNVIYLVYVWCSVWQKRYATLPYELDTICYSYSSFFFYVMLICYGDDLIMTIKEEVLAMFNPIIIRDVLALYDIKFTDACKTGTQYASLNVFDKATSFLKRNIACHPLRRKVFVAKMDKRAIQETCNWIHKCANVREMSMISCQSMLLNAHGHGPEYYENMRKRVRYFWQKLNVDCPIPSWSETDYRIFGANDMRIHKFI
ncbi:MAG: polyprotein [Mekrijarvi iflavirus]|nr:MAG: polyprotein [Mekrijarvi iflavirus]